MSRLSTQETIEILQETIEGLLQQEMTNDKELIVKDFKEALEELQEEYSESSDYYLYIKGLQRALNLFMNSKDEFIDKLEEFFDELPDTELRNVMDFIEWEKGTWDVYSHYCEVLYWREAMGDYASHNPVLEIAVSQYLV